LELHSQERHKPHAQQSRDDVGDAVALQFGRDFRVFEALADGGEGGDGQQPADTGAECVGQTVRHGGEVALLHEERAAKDGTVHGNQRQEDAQRHVQRRKIPLEDHLQQLHDARNHRDEDDQRQEREIRASKACTQPRQRPFAEQVFVNQVVDGHGNRQHEADGQTQPEGGLHVLGDGQIGAHAQEVGEDHVVDEDGAEEDFYHNGYGLWVIGYRSS